MKKQDKIQIDVTDKNFDLDKMVEQLTEDLKKKQRIDPFIMKVEIDYAREVEEVETNTDEFARDLQKKYGSDENPLGSSTIRNCNNKLFRMMLNETDPETAAQYIIPEPGSVVDEFIKLSGLGTLTINKARLTEVLEIDLDTIKDVIFKVSYDPEEMTFTIEPKEEEEEVEETPKKKKTEVKSETKPEVVKVKSGQNKKKAIKNRKAKSTEI